MNALSVTPVFMSCLDNWVNFHICVCSVCLPRGESTFKIQLPTFFLSGLLWLTTAIEGDS